MDKLLLSIDIGTSSVRCALVTPSGAILAQQKQSIRCWSPVGRMAFSSNDIWASLVECVNDLVFLSSYEASSICGIGLDATASLLFLTEDRVPISLPDSPDVDILGWMDHRAQPQSEQLNQLLAKSGSNQRLIPEFGLPKALWLKQTHPDLWAKCHYIVELGDYLVWKLTGVLCYSNCSVSRSFNKDLVKAAMFDDVHSRFISDYVAVGTATGSGLCKPAADALKLVEHTPVSSAIIDAYGGTLSTILSHHPDEEPNTPSTALHRLSMIVGTSTIYTATSRTSNTIAGTFGPRPSVLPGYYHNSVGESAAGYLIDFIVTNHPSYEDCLYRARQKGLRITDYLNNHLQTLSGDKPVSFLTRELHMLPYFAGNRTPRMDMSLTGMVCGLRTDNSEDNLALHYLCTIQALALGARHSIESLASEGYRFNVMTAAGGLAKNALFLSEHCNVTGIPIAIPEYPDAMMLGGAMTAGLAAGLFTDWTEAMQSVSRYRRLLQPDPAVATFFKKKYDVFLSMHEDQIKYRQLMQE